MTSDAARRPVILQREAAPWFLRFSPVADPQARVVCFAHAGGGASSYFGWARLLGPAIEQLAVQLPGRETRMTEPPVTDLGALSATLASAIKAWADVPVVLMGHSFGALLAFEVARALMANHQIGVRALVVSAAQAPQQPRTIVPLRETPDDVLIDQLARRYGGIPAPVLGQPELLRAFIPVMRADLTMLETYRYVEVTPLACPVLALLGEEDELATREMMEPWAELTTGPFALRAFAGGHFFIKDVRASVAAEVAALATGGSP